MLSLTPFITLTQQESRVLALAHAAVASAVGVTRKQVQRAVQGAPPPLEPAIRWDHYMVECIPDTDKWRDMLEPILGATESPIREELIGIEFTTFSPLLDLDGLFESRARRRMDAFLDYMDTDFCCYDTQSTFASNRERLLEASMNKSEVLSYARTASQYISYVHPLAGMAANLGLNAINSDQVQASGPDDIDRYARLISVYETAIHGEDKNAVASSARLELRDLIQTGAVMITAEAELLSQSPPDSRTQNLKRLQSTQKLRLAVLDTFANGKHVFEAADAAQVVFPSVLGLRLSEAVSTLNAHGLSFSYTDAIAPGGNPRVILNLNNWIVARQEVQPGEATRTLALFAIKRGESYSVDYS